jgi:hypothetical protein
VGEACPNRFPFRSATTGDWTDHGAIGRLEAAGPLPNRSYGIKSVEQQRMSRDCDETAAVAERNRCPRDWVGQNDWLRAPAPAGWAAMAFIPKKTTSGQWSAKNSQAAPTLKTQDCQGVRGPVNN